MAVKEVKKQLEVLFINYFRECYNEFPGGKIIPSESPDFVVKIKNKHLLGIELTRLNPANAAPVSFSQQNDIEFQENLIDGAKELFETKSNLKLFVKFLFSRKNKIAPEQEMLVLVRVVSLIRERVKNKNKRSFFKIVLSENILPEGVKEVLIVHHPGMGKSVWERSNNLGISNDVVDDIKQSICKKDEKLRLYQKQHLNFYWLLITTDRLRGVKNVNLASKVKNHNFHSRFQQVFLFDLVKAKVYELV